MSQSTNTFIDELANDLNPGRQLHPAQRALLWGFILLTFNVLAFLAYQPFRPGFLNQLMEFSGFRNEMILAFFLTYLLVYIVFIQMVPGRKTPTLLYWLGAGSFIIWLSQIWPSFYETSSLHSRVGARGLCVEEVALYGLIGTFSLFYFLNKIEFRFSRFQYFLMGTTSGLIPGVLMQLACMYTPIHNLLLHYFPAVIVGGLAALLMPLFKRNKHSNLNI